MIRSCCSIRVVVVDQLRLSVLLRWETPSLSSRTLYHHTKTTTTTTTTSRSYITNPTSPTQRRHLLHHRGLRPSLQPSWLWWWWSSSSFRFYSSSSAPHHRPDVPSTTLFMPSLSPTMEEGSIVKWHKMEGETVKENDTLADIETDKAVQAYESSDVGFLAKILVQEKSGKVKVGVPIAIVVSDPKHVELFKDYTPTSSPPSSFQQSAPPPPQQQPPSPQQPSQSSRPTAAPSGAPPSSPVPVFLMPALSPTMEKGKITNWIKSEGEKIEIGQYIFDVETDKSVAHAEALDEGYLAKILVQSGSSAHVGSPIAIIVSDQSELEKYKNYNLEMTLASLPSSSPSSSSSTATTPLQPQTPVPPPSATSPSPSSPGTRIAASPLARSVAAQKGIELSAIAGTGPNCRIIRADVDEYVPPVTTTTATPAKPPSLPPDYTDIPNSNIRNITAQRLTFSKQNVPHYYLTIEIVVDKLLKLREELNAFGLAGGKTSDNFKLSVNDFVIKAAAVALQAVPEVNSEWKGEFIRKYHKVHINVAVNTPKGLLTPIVRDVDKMGLKTINSEVKAKATRAQEGKSTLDDLSLGTFTISNLGMFGITQFAAVISPPQSAILAVGSTKKVPVLVDDQEETPKVKVANILTVTLSCDHRVIDGAVGAQWLQVFKDVLENPIKFLL